MFKKRNKKKAFTLIELLVVIAIIAIIATIAVVASQNSRRGARDVKRLADVRQLRVALELYHNNNGSYPGSLNALIPDYLAKIPQAPSPADGDCTSENNQYVYSSDGGTYTISFCLGSSVGEYTAGYKTANQMGIETTAGGGDFSCGETFVDSRDGNSYGTVLIGDQCWFTKDLAYLPVVHGHDDFKNAALNNTPAYGVFGYDGNDVAAAKENIEWRYHVNYYELYGALYNWWAAVGTSGVAGNQGVCPSGWHIPTISEWQALISTINANSAFHCGPNNGTAKAVASASGWTEEAGISSCSPAYNQTTNNASGLNLPPSGVRVVEDRGGFLITGNDLESHDPSIGHRYSFLSLDASSNAILYGIVDYEYDYINAMIVNEEARSAYEAEENEEMRNYLSTQYGIDNLDELMEAYFKFFVSQGFPVRCVKN